MAKSFFCNLFAHSIQRVNYNHAFGISQLINMDKIFFFLVQCFISEIQKYILNCHNQMQTEKQTACISLFFRSDSTTKWAVLGQGKL